MFNICKCNQFHFLYANSVSLLLAKVTRMPVNWEAALVTAVKHNVIAEGKESSKNPDTFLDVRLVTSTADR